MFFLERLKLIKQFIEKDTAFYHKLTFAKSIVEVAGAPDYTQARAKLLVFYTDLQVVVKFVLGYLNMDLFNEIDTDANFIDLFLPYPQFLAKSIIQPASFGKNPDIILMFTIPDNEDAATKKLREAQTKMICEYITIVTFKEKAAELRGLIKYPKKKKLEIELAQICNELRNFYLLLHNERRALTAAILPPIRDYSMNYVMPSLRQAQLPVLKALDSIRSLLVDLAEQWQKNQALGLEDISALARTPATAVIAVAGAPLVNAATPPATSVADTGRNALPANAENKDAGNDKDKDQDPGQAAMAARPQGSTTKRKIVLRKKLPLQFSISRVYFFQVLPVTDDVSHFMDRLNELDLGGNIVIISPPPFSVKNNYALVKELVDNYHPSLQRLLECKINKLFIKRGKMTSKTITRIENNFAQAIETVASTVAALYQVLPCDMQVSNPYATDYGRKPTNRITVISRHLDLAQLPAHAGMEVTLINQDELICVFAEVAYAVFTVIDYLNAILNTFSLQPDLIELEKLLLEISENRIVLQAAYEKINHDQPNYPWVLTQRCKFAELGRAINQSLNAACLRVENAMLSFQKADMVEIERMKESGQAVLERMQLLRQQLDEIILEPAPSLSLVRRSGLFAGGSTTQLAKDTPNNENENENENERRSSAVWG